VILQAALLLFPAAMAYAAASDLLTMTISNKLSLALLAGFLVLAPAVGLGWSTIGVHVGLAVLTLFVTFALFAFNLIGGGDAKLTAAIVLWMGPQDALAFALAASIFGGVLTMLFLGFRRVPLPAAAAGTPWIARLHSAGNGVPYGIALAAGALVVYPKTIWFAAM